MVSARDNLICDVCNEGFCEIIEKTSKGPDTSGSANIGSDEVDEEKKRANEQYRMVFNRGD